jgi:hypothetical protein
MSRADVAIHLEATCVVGDVRQPITSR